MMPPTMLVPHEEMLYSPHTSPELRRMDMFNRARRAEREAMINSITISEASSFISNGRNKHESFTFGRMLSSIRNGLGHALVSAGNRIQSAA